MNYDQFLGALCLWREARGASLPAKTAIWSVIQNRANDPSHRWPKSIHDVIVQPYQFSSFLASDPNVTAWPTDRHPADWQAWLDCCNVVQVPLTADPVDGATNYESEPDGTPRPNWTTKMTQVATIGPFRFYRG